MPLSPKSVALAGASLLLLGASLSTAEALPVAPLQSGVHAASLDQVMYGKPSRRGLSSHSKCGRTPSRC